MYILYDNEFNDNVHNEQDKLLRWIHEAARLNPDVPLDMLLSAAKDWVDNKNYVVSELKGYFPQNDNIMSAKTEEVEETLPVEPEIVEIVNTEEVDNLTALLASEREISSSLRFELENVQNQITELKAANESLKVQLENIPETSTEVFVESDMPIEEEVEAPTFELEEEFEEEVKEEYENTHETHSIAQEEALTVIKDEVNTKGDIEDTLIEEETEAPIFALASDEGDEIIVEEPIEEHFKTVDDFLEAQDVENGEPKKSINDTVDFSKRKRGRKGSALAALQNEGEENNTPEMSEEEEGNMMGRGGRSKRRPQRFNMNDEKQSRIRDNLVAIYSDPDALKDL